MDKCLRPQAFSAEADIADGARWQLWKRAAKSTCGLRRTDISAAYKRDILIDYLTLPYIPVMVMVCCFIRHSQQAEAP